jgi:undecaprenyl-diphosphatase
MSEPAPITTRVPQFARHVPVLLSSLVLLASLVVLFQIDIPFARFVRAIHVQWLVDLGYVAGRLGSGEVLTAISIAILLAGWLAKQTGFQRAGLESLIAHGIVAGIANGLKHLIGRPRPRFTHSGGFQLWPSWDSGLDSFPSGHTSASFAIATVLAKPWPFLGWLFYGVAGMIAASRVWRGSHFPTDVVAGMILGVVVGAVVSHPIRDWRTSLSGAVVPLGPVVVGITSLLWIGCHLAPSGWIEAISLAVGGFCVVGGLASRMARFSWGKEWTWLGNRQLANVLIAFGLAVTTGSWVVLGLVGLALLTHWIDYARPADGARVLVASHEGSVPLVVESAYALGVLLTALMIQGLKGIVPLL